MNKPEMQAAIIAFWNSDSPESLEVTDPSVLTLIEQMGDYLEVTTGEN